MAADDPLQPLLDEAEAKLSRRLREACEVEAQGVSSESAAEIRKLEDSLLSAAMAAEQVLTVRRHMKRQAGDTAESSGASAGSPALGAKPKVAEAVTRPGTAAPRGGRQASVAHAAAPAEPGPQSQEVDSPEDVNQTTTVREFTDCKGRTWRAWPVTPNTARARPSSLRTLGEFQEGWICFESMDDSARRRLPRQATRWSELRQEELERLLDEAISVPGRKMPRADPGREPDIRLH